MKTTRQTVKFSTSFLDLILGSVGAFALLMILVCLASRGTPEVEEGTELPDNVLSFSTMDDGFEISRSLRFFVALCNDRQAANPFDSLCFSHPVEENSQTPLDGSSLQLEYSSDSCYQLKIDDKDKNRKNVFLYVWLADWPMERRLESKLGGDESKIDVEVEWTDKEYGVKRRLSLRKDAGFASGIFLTTGETDETLARKALDEVDYRNVASTTPPDWKGLKDEKYPPPKYLSQSFDASGDDKWELYHDDDDVACLKANGYDMNKTLAQNVFLIAPPKLKEKNFSRLEFWTLKTEVNELGRAVEQTKISFVSCGTRATCVRFAEKERRLYVCPRNEWINASDFVAAGILTPVENAPKWRVFDLTDEVERYLQKRPEADAELVIQALADAIACPIYEKPSPITRTSPLVFRARSAPRQN